jgi:hypothetical protein
VLRIAGWAATTRGPCSRVELTLDGRPLGRARLGRYRPDVAKATQQGIAAFSGFSRWSISRRPPQSDDQPTTGPWSSGRAGRRGGSGALRALICSHALGYDGAPLVLADLCRWIGRENGIEVEVLSFADGPLRAVLEQAGLEVHVWPAVFTAASETYEPTLARLCDWVAGRQYDVALVNTVIGFPGADACLRLEIPTVWAIHESYPLPLLPHVFKLDPEVASRLEQTFRNVDMLLFMADATRRLYQAYLPGTPCVVLPYEVDVDGLGLGERTLTGRGPGPVTVVLVDDEQLIRSAVAQALSVGGIDLIGEAADAQDANGMVPRPAS